MPRLKDLAGSTLRTVSEEFRRHPISTTALAIGGTLLLKSVDDSLMRYLNRRPDYFEDTRTLVDGNFETEISQQEEELSA